MQALILAAGLGRRLGELTVDNTKCMLEVNGIRLIDRMLLQLSHYNINRIIIVVGHKAENVIQHVKKNHPDLNVIFVDNPVYDKTNNIYSLWLARELMEQDDTLLLESDLIFEDKVLSKAIENPFSSVALVSKYQTWMDGTMMKINEEYDIKNFIPKKDFKYKETDSYYKTVNIYKFSQDFIKNHYLPFLEAYIRVLGENEYYEQVLRVLTLIDNTEIKAVPIGDLKWYEIDDVQDLRIAETIFATPEKRLEKLQQSYGGYWRYPDILDFCYLVNPYFPTSKMIDEMKANFEVLLRQYPSGMNVNSLIASKCFSIKHDEIVVGNGAAELIKSLMGVLEGRFGMVTPSFEEYPNRLKTEDIIKFEPQNPDFKYSANDLIDFFNINKVDNLLIVNPDNPSGNYIEKKDILKLAEWAEKKKIRLIIDESFVDFADEKDSTLLHSEILLHFPNLCVIKSISKSYGVPGLRLGILASGDMNLINRMRKDVAIWNINSFAEFYMQIYDKYEKDYLHACEIYRKERDLFFNELTNIKWLRVIPSQANYFLCELQGITSHELTLKLLTEYNIFIKDCSHKQGFSGRGQYVRLSIRDRKDDHKLIQALKSIQITH